MKLGDVFEIPLSNGKKAFAQFICRDKFGQMIQVFDFISQDTPIDIFEIKKAKPLFRPIFTSLTANISRGIWEKIGYFPVVGFQHPGFVSAFYDEKTGIAYMWFLWDGQQEYRLGPKLPKQYMHLEYNAVLSPFDIAHRIETGEILFPFGELIKNNRFFPKE